MDKKPRKIRKQIREDFKSSIASVLEFNFYPVFVKKVVKTTVKGVLLEFVDGTEEWFPRRYVYHRNQFINEINYYINIGQRFSSDSLLDQIVSYPDHQRETHLLEKTNKLSNFTEDKNIQLFFIPRWLIEKKSIFNVKQLESTINKLVDLKVKDNKELIERREREKERQEIKNNIYKLPNNKLFEVPK